MVYGFKELRRDVGVETHTILEPFAESHKNLDDIDNGCFFIEPFDCSSEFCELIGGGSSFFGRGVVGQVLKERIYAVENLIDEFGARDAGSGPRLFPATIRDPFSESLCGDADFLGDDLLRFALHVEQASVLALLLPFFFSSHS